MWTDEERIAEFWIALEEIEKIKRDGKTIKGGRKMNGLRVCKGEYTNRWYIIPTIEYESLDWSIEKEHCICVAFLKWYIGISWFVHKNIDR